MLANIVQRGYNTGVKSCQYSLGKNIKGDTRVKKEFLAPTAEVVSFLSQDALMSYYDEGDIGGLTPGESGAGGSSGWGDF